MTPVLVLLPSPFLGPAVWHPVARVLASRGWRVITPSAPASPLTPEDVLAGFLTALPTDAEFILVPHSNAGLYVPALAGQRTVRASVFVDAALPARRGRIQLAPPGALLEVLRGLADADGVLPPWTTWWPEADVAALFPDGSARQHVEREQHRLPLSYFEGSLPQPAAWDRLPGGYLAFGDTYDNDRAEASRRGWPVVTLAGAHLHMLADPGQVAGEILALTAAAGITGPGP